MSRRAYRPLPSTPTVRATGIVLGVHLFEGEYYLREDFVQKVTDLNRQLRLSSSWIGVPLDDVPDYAEVTHEAMGILVQAPITGGRLRGWLKRIYGIGAEVVLVSETDRQHDWILTSVRDGAFSYTSNLGEFDLAKLPTLVSLLILHAPEIPLGADMSQYVKAIHDPMRCELYQPPAQGFFAGLQRYARRRLAEKAAKEGQS